MQLIVTRPEPDATRTARALIRLGHTAILSPMLDIVLDSNANIPLRPYQAVVATSSNGIRALAALAATPVSAEVPLYAVGDQSALEAKRAGFVATRSAGGALDELVALVSRELSPGAGPILYLAGEERSGDLAGRLRGQGYEVEDVVLYRAKPRSHLAGVAADALKTQRADGVLFYSRRSAAAFALALRAGGLAPLGEEVACFCISAVTAEAIEKVASGRILVAPHPDQLALFAMIEAEEAARRAV